MQPMPLSCVGYQDYAFIYPSQKDNLYKLVLQESTGYMMDPEEFCIELEDMVVASNTEILYLTLLKCVHEYFGEVVHNFIIGKFDYLCDPSALGAKQVVYGKWVIMIDKNCIDYKVPGCGENGIGVVVGRHSKLPRKPSLDHENIKLMSKTFQLSDLNRYKKTHDGKFFMFSYRLIQMSSGSMVQVGPLSDHN